MYNKNVLGIGLTESKEGKMFDNLWALVYESSNAVNISEGTSYIISLEIEIFGKRATIALYNCPMWGEKYVSVELWAQFAKLYPDNQIYGDKWLILSAIDILGQ